MVGNPICDVPGSKVTIRNRISKDYFWTSKLLPTSKECINLGSYNYLGYAENEGPCTDAAVESVEKSGEGGEKTFRVIRGAATRSKTFHFKALL